MWLEVAARCFFVWMLHGSTKVAVRAVALPSAKHETAQKQLIRDELDSRGQERRQPPRGVVNSSKGRTCWNRLIKDTRHAKGTRQKSRLDLQIGERSGYTALLLKLQ